MRATLVLCPAIWVPSHRYSLQSPAVHYCCSVPWGLSWDFDLLSPGPRPLLHLVLPRPVLTLHPTPSRGPKSPKGAFKTQTSIPWGIFICQHLGPRHHCCSTCTCTLSPRYPGGSANLSPESLLCHCSSLLAKQPQQPEGFP